MWVSSHWCALRATAVVTPADTGRDRLLDAHEQRLERVGQLVFGHVELGGDHAATDVDTDGRRDHRVLRGDHRTDGCADADVRVGHEGDMTLHDREPGRLLCLANGLRSSISLAQETSFSLMLMGMSPPPCCRVACGRREPHPVWRTEILAVNDDH